MHSAVFHPFKAMLWIPERDKACRQFLSARRNKVSDTYTNADIVIILLRPFSPQMIGGGQIGNPGQGSYADALVLPHRSPHAPGTNGNAAMGTLG
jgi:hypothetical protein